MKTTMASAALLLVLALALVSAPLTVTAQAKKQKKKDDVGESEQTGPTFSCAILCNGRKGVDFVVCKDSCELSQRINEMSIGRIQCNDKCTQQKGITKPAMKVCQEKCEKDYKVKAAEVTAACNKTCDKQTFKNLQDGCKQLCTPPS